MKKYSKKIVEGWWSSLDDRIKEEIMDDVFPDDIVYEADDEWKRVDWEIKLKIYEENNI